MLKRKKNFILLELLIGIALITTTILPFLHYPYRDVKTQIETLYLMELQHAAQTELAKWETAFYQKDEELLKRAFGEKQIEAQLDRAHNTITLTLGPKIQKKFERIVYFNHSSRKKLSNGSIASLVNIKVEYFSHPKKSQDKSLLSVKRQIVAQKKT